MGSRLYPSRPTHIGSVDGERNTVWPCAGQTGRVLADQLTDTQTPCLILQGDRDPFGTLAEIKGYRLSAAIDVHFLGDGEHSFIPRKSSRRIKTENWETAIKEMIRFISSID